MGRGVRCVLCRFVYARETNLPGTGRAVMPSSVSVEYECDVSCNYILFTHSMIYFESDTKTINFACIAGQNNL
jgi:hypothetical protein